ncbi:hypothetical protein U1Q18_052348, partial [Sarracenia purpurea var. burkii]
ARFDKMPRRSTSNHSTHTYYHAERGLHRVLWHRAWYDHAYRAWEERKNTLAIFALFPDHCRSDGITLMKQSGSGPECKNAGKGPSSALDRPLSIDFHRKSCRGEKEAGDASAPPHA